MLNDSAPSDWCDTIAEHLDELNALRIDIKLGAGKARAYKQFGCCAAADEVEAGGGVKVFFDTVSMSIDEAAGSCWAVGNQFIAEDNMRRESKGQPTIHQVHIILKGLNEKGLVIFTADERIKQDEFGVAFAEKGETSAEKLAIAMANDRERENRRLRAELRDAQDSVRDRDSMFAESANTFVGMLGKYSDERMALLDKMQADGFGYDSPEKMAVYNRLAGVAEVVAEGFAEEGFGFFATKGTGKKSGDGDEDEETKKNLMRAPVEAISDEAWETILDYTNIEESELAEAKANFIAMGERKVPTTQQALMAGAFYSIIEEHLDTLKMDLPRRDLKHFQRIGALAKAKIKRKERRDARLKEKADREAKAAAASSSP